MADFFTDPKAPQMVRILRKLAAEGPMPMRAFTFYAELAPRHAIVLRDRMFSYGIAAYDPDASPDSRERHVKATKEGADLLRHIDGAEPILARAQKKNRDAT